MRARARASSGAQRELPPARPSVGPPVFSDTRGCNSCRTRKVAGVPPHRTVDQLLSIRCRSTLISIRTILQGWLRLQSQDSGCQQPCCRAHTRLAKQQQPHLKGYDVGQVNSILFLAACAVHRTRWPAPRPFRQGEVRVQSVSGPTRAQPRPPCCPVPATSSPALFP